MWTTGVAERFANVVWFLAIGPENGRNGAPTQMSVFELGRVESRTFSYDC